MMSDVYGPIDFLILEMQPGASFDATVAALDDLIERQVIALYDLMLVHRDDDGSCRELDLADSPFAKYAGARSALFDEEDMREAANALEADRDALIVLYENRWAAPFAAAARHDGIEVVASARLTAQEIMDALEAVEAES
jgi:hypothetical protein